MLRDKNSYECLRMLALWWGNWESIRYVFFFNHVSPLFQRTVLVLWSDWAGLISIFESPIFRHTQENHLFCCSYPYFCWLSPPFFAAETMGCSAHPRLGNAAPGLPMFGIRQAASAQHQHRRRCRIRGETARGALRQKKRHRHRADAGNPMGN